MHRIVNPLALTDGINAGPLPERGEVHNRPRALSLIHSEGGEGRAQTVLKGGERGSSLQHGVSQTGPQDTVTPAMPP